MLRGLCICLVELGALAFCAAAEASTPTPIRVEFEPDAVCSTPEEFYDAVRGRSDRLRLAEGGERAFYVKVKLTQSGSNVRGELRVIHEHGETNPRAVEGDSCDVVVAALSLTAALAVDAVVAEGAQAAPPQAPVPAPAPSPVSADTAAPETSATETSVSFVLGAHALAAQVLAPGATFGGGLAARVRLDTPSSFDPSFGLALAHTRNDLFETPETILVRWWVAHLTFCPGRLDLGEAFSVEPCALGGAGLLVVSGRALEEPKTATRAWWSAGILLRGSAALGPRAALELELGAAAPLSERRFVTAPAGESVAETQTLSPLASIGITYTF